MKDRKPEAPREASAPESASAKRTVRAELIVATLALVTSACASLAAIVQTREATVQTRATISQAETVAKQLGASVWPYITIDDDFSPNRVAINITNQGLGPALIRSFTISVDGRPLMRLRDLSRPGQRAARFRCRRYRPRVGHSALGIAADLFAIRSATRLGALAKRHRQNAHRYLLLLAAQRLLVTDFQRNGTENRRRLWLVGTLALVLTAIRGSARQ